MRVPIARLSHALLAAMALPLGACLKVPTQSASLQASPRVRLTASQLQIGAFELGRGVSLLIEEAADSIRTVSADPEVRRNALLWKVSAIPLVQEAALRDDPVIAVADLLVLTMQQEDYFTTGSGAASFGDAQPLAVAAARTARTRVAKYATGAMRGDTLPTDFVEGITRWVADNPMRGPALRRGSILNSDWAVIGLSEVSLEGTVGHLDRTVVNLTYRLSYLNETLAEQARWNAELMAEQAMAAPRVDTLLNASSAALRSVNLLVDDMPALIDREREAMMKDIDRQRLAMMTDIDRQRVLAFQDLGVQRELAFREIADQRVALDAALTAQRVAAFQAADSLAQRSIAQSAVMLRRLVWQLTLGALIVVAALVAGGLLILNRLRAAGAVETMRGT